jgi:hypothetical protein
MKQLLVRALAVVPILLLVSSLAMADNVAITLCQNGYACQTVTGTTSATFSGAYGTYQINTSTGINFGTTLDVASQNGLNTNNTDPLMVYVSGTGFTLGGGGNTTFSYQFSGNFSGSGTFSSSAYLDNTNTLCSPTGNTGGTACGTLEASLGPFTSSPFSGSTSFTALTANTYALGQVLSISLSPGAAFNSLDSSITVPEPASLFLMGAGLLGLGGTLRRKVLKK